MFDYVQDRCRKNRQQWCEMPGETDRKRIVFMLNHRGVPLLHLFHLDTIEGE